MALDSETRQRFAAPATIPVPRAAYVHVPFCRHRCGYCNFSVLTGRDHLAGDFLKALETELSELGQPREVDTIFVGGGTPTHLGAAWLGELLKLVERWHPLAEGGELSIEANPCDISPEVVRAARDAGVNRISLGVQSFNTAKLSQLERDHDGEIAESAIRLCQELIGNVSIDLIFAAPGETLSEWLEDVSTATRVGVDHVSTYGLTFEKGTQFWNRRERGELSSAAEETELDMYVEGTALLKSSGFEHYEVSNFARRGRRCQHNLTYWRGLGWYAVGPGAARFVDGVREVNHRSASTYIKKLRSGHSATCETEELTVEQLIRERVAFGLRMLDGYDLGDAGNRSDVDALLHDEIKMLAEREMVTRSGDKISLTSRGLLVSDSVLSWILG